MSPKIRTGTLSDAIASSSLDQQFHSQPDPTMSTPSEPSSDNASRTAGSQQWGGIIDLKSLLRHMIKGTYEPFKEQPPLPNVPVIFPDSIYRVCGAPPDSLCTINHIAAGVIHIFPWSPSLNTAVIGGQSVVTYGHLCKVLSPKEAKDKAKQAMEKRKNLAGDKDSGVKGGEEAREEEATVVRVVCHDAEMLERGHNKGEIHSGKVWVRKICINPSKNLGNMKIYYNPLILK